nr:LacI family DNA-binding transcriptional regulator [Bifidobacterium margollesii]
MRDVAKRAGVSLSTVSLAVNGTGYVADETRARIEAAMAELNYVPNELARNLYRGRTNLIGVTMPTIAHPFFAQLSAALQRHLHEAGLRMMLCSTADQERGEQEYVDMLKRQMMDGLIIGSHNTRPPRYWRDVRRPVVAFDRFLCEGVPAVVSDHEKGGRLAAQRFIETGARHVVEIGGPRSQFHDLSDSSEVDGGESSTFTTVRYHRTFERMIAESGIRFDYVTVEHVSMLPLFEQAAEETFARFDDVDAIIAPDLAAAHCVRVALREGRRIPQDLQIIAYDGTYVTEVAGMKITAIRQDLDALAGGLVERMRATIDEMDAGRADVGKVRSNDDRIDEIVAVRSDVAARSDMAVQSDVAARSDMPTPYDVIPVAFVPGETTR